MQTLKSLRVGLLAGALALLGAPGGCPAVPSGSSEVADQSEAGSNSSGDSSDDSAGSATPQSADDSNSDDVADASPETPDSSGDAPIPPEAMPDAADGMGDSNGSTTPDGGGSSDDAEGAPTPDAPDSDGAADLILGIFAGELSGERRESLSGGAAGTFRERLAERLTLADAPRPAGLIIPGFSSLPDILLEISQVGQTQIIEGALNGGGSYRYDIEVTSTRDEAEAIGLGLKIVLQSTSGNLTQRGGGIASFVATASAGALAAEMDVTYEVEQRASTLVLDVQQIFELTGLLSAE